MHFAHLMGEDVGGAVVCPAEFGFRAFPGARGEGDARVEQALGVRLHDGARGGGVVRVGLAELVRAGIRAESAAEKARPVARIAPRQNDGGGGGADGEGGELVFQAALVDAAVFQQIAHGRLVQRFRDFAGHDESGLDEAALDHGGDLDHAVQDAEAGVGQIEDGAALRQGEGLVDDAGGGGFEATVTAEIKTQRAGSPNEEIILPAGARITVTSYTNLNSVENCYASATYVKELSWSGAPFFIDGLVETVRSRQTKVQIIRSEVLRANLSVAAKLGVELGDSVIFLRRHIMGEEGALLVQEGYLLLDPRRPVVEAELEATYITGLFTGSGQGLIKRAVLSILPTLMSEEDARTLDCPPGSVGFRLAYSFFDASLAPLAVGWFIAPEDRLKLTAQIGIGG